MSNQDTTEGDCPPTICSACAPLLESSNLEWVKVGGMNVGMHRGTLKWRLRDKYSSGMMKNNAMYSQRLAAAARLVHALKDHVTDDEMLERMERFLKPIAESSHRN